MDLAAILEDLRSNPESADAAEKLAALVEGGEADDSDALGNLVDELIGGAEDADAPPNALALDPPVSEKQRRAMYAAREGKSTLGIPKWVGEEFVGKARDDDPEVKAEAAGVVFMTPGGKILLLKRSDDGDHAGEWGFPGGGREDGDEDPAACARREAREELGDHPEDALVPLDRRTSDEGTDFTTFVQGVDDAFEPELNDEHDDHGWFDLDDLPGNLHPGVSATLHAQDGGVQHGQDAKLSHAEVEYGAGRPESRCEICEYHEDNGCRLVEDPIDPDGWCQLFTANAVRRVKIDRDHDGPWVSCMSKDGATMYVNKNLPREAEILDKVVDLDEDLLHHEVPEHDDLQERIAVFKAENQREPRTHERKEIYLKAHASAGTPSEREYCRRKNIDWDALSAWFRGEEARLENLPVKNPTNDADVRPVRHHHGDLEVTMDQFVLDGVRVVVAGDAKWEESKHPRDKSGKFGSGEWRTNYWTMRLNETSPPPNATTATTTRWGEAEKNLGKVAALKARLQRAQRALKKAGRSYVADPPSSDLDIGWAKGYYRHAQLNSEDKTKFDEYTRIANTHLAHAEQRIARVEQDAARIGKDAEFHEADHPRDNDGKFGSGGGGGSAGHGEHGHGAPSPSLREMLAGPGASKAVAGAAGKFLKEHGKGLIGHHVNHSAILPAIHMATAFAVEHLGATVPEAMAVSAVGYAVHQLMHKLGATPEKGIEKVVGLLVGVGRALLDAHKIGELRSRVTGDAEPKNKDETSAALERFIKILETTPIKDLLETGKKGAPPAKAAMGAADERIQFAYDRGSVREYDDEGRLRVLCTNISKANVCPYLGREIPDSERLGLKPDKIYHLLRDPDELDKAAPTFNGIQLLRKHVPVNTEDAQLYDVVGCTGTDAEFADPYLRNSLSVWTAEAIELILSGRQKELSSAYRYRADMTPGEFKGVPYDGVMRDISGNHVAIVEEGRAGSDVVVADERVGMARAWDRVEAALREFMETVS